MDFGKILTAIIFIVIAGIVLFAVFPSMLSAGVPLIGNSTYIKDYPATITLLSILPVIIVAIVIILFVEFFKREWPEWKI